MHMFSPVYNSMLFDFNIFLDAFIHSVFFHFIFVCFCSWKFYLQLDIMSFILFFFFVFKLSNFLIL